MKQVEVIENSVENYTRDDYIMALNILARYGMDLKYFNFQTEQMCKLAVSQNGLALCDVINQTEELCLLAVRQNGMAIKFVNRLFITKSLCLEAYKQNRKSICIIKERLIESLKLIN